MPTPLRSSFFARKNVETLVQEAEGESQGLKRTLGLLDLTSLGIGATVGAGIFVLTGQVAALRTGPAIVLALVLAAVTSGLAALCFAELAALLPISGSAYTYAYATLGEFPAWTIAWLMILEYGLSASTVAAGWSGYVSNLLKDMGITLPRYLSTAPWAYDSLQGRLTPTGALVDLPAFLIVLFLTLVLALGIRESATLNTLMVLLKIGVIVLFVAIGISHIDTLHWSPFLPPNTGTPGNFGLSGLLSGSAVIFFAYIGFDAVSTAAQESRRPQRDLPLGILLSLLISTLLYALFALVLTGIVPYGELNVAAPVGIAIDRMGLPWLSWIIKLGIIAALSSVILVTMLGQIRIFFSMGKDGLLPPLFSRVHSRRRTPLANTVLTGLFVACSGALLPLGILGELASIGTLFVFVLVCAGVMILRKTEPNATRSFRTPWVPTVPILGILGALYLIFSLPRGTWWRLLIWILIGTGLYLFRPLLSRSKTR